ncbi:MAG: sigma-70 family RNA polymerase sigma factor [Acidobacteriia bacterium]|nr:sigma-70 family RNA polymerase sigma factor [Terriglobia bacterium]
MDLSKLPVAELIQRCIDADATAWEEFMRRYNHLITSVVFKTIRRYVPPTSTLVEDLVQETYLRLCARDYTALRSYNSEHENAIYGYLRKVTSSVVIDYFRKPGNRPVPVVPIDAELFPDQPSTAKRDNRIDLGRMRQLLEELLASDPDRQRDLAIFDYDMSGCTAREIAQMLNMTTKQVENRLARMRKKLRDRLGPEDES